MSDTYLAFCPKDEFFVPSKESRERTKELLSSFSPERDLLGDVVRNAPEVLNLESASTLTCVACGRSGGLKHDEYKEVYDAFFKQLPIEELMKCDDYYRVFGKRADLDFTMPCCGSVLPFAKLEFDVPVAVCSYYLQLVNPGYDEGLGEEDSERIWEYEQDPYREGAVLTTRALAELESALGCGLMQLYLLD